MITSQNDDPGCATKDQFHSMNHILSLISLMNVWSHKVHAYVDKALINLSVSRRISKPIKHQFYYDY